jgi:RNA polymerase sigma factor (sigma-70 family)
MTNGAEGSVQIDRLLNACMRYDRKAQVKLYELYSKTMYNTSIRIVQDTMLAEDIVQESFLKAFMSLGNFRKEVPFLIWLRRIVINKSLDELRKKKAEFTPIDEDMVVFDHRLEETAEEQENSQTLITKIKEEVNKLTDGYRVIFSLFYFEGYDHDEIAHILNISASTSRSQLTRARQKILNQLKCKAG